MSASLTSVKLPTDLVEAARSDASLFRRSISGQVEHWANLGRAMETSLGMTMEGVRAALEGRFDAAMLTDQEAAQFDRLLGAAINETTTTEARAFRASFNGKPNTDL